MLKIPYDWTDLGFRLLFSLIFLALGAEHLFSDALIQSMMPDWLIFKRFFSVVAGLLLLSGGFSIMFGFQVRLGAFLLGGLVLLITLAVHGQGVLAIPPNLPQEWQWLWEVYQRSNFAKNLCLLGVCLHLTNHRLGRLSLESWLAERQQSNSKT